MRAAKLTIKISGSGQTPPTAKQVSSRAETMLESHWAFPNALLLSMLRKLLFVRELLPRIPKFSPVETANYFDGTPAARTERLVAI